MRNSAIVSSCAVLPITLLWRRFPAAVELLDANAWMAWKQGVQTQKQIHAQTGQAQSKDVDYNLKKQQCDNLQMQVDKMKAQKADHKDKSKELHKAIQHRNKEITVLSNMVQAKDRDTQTKCGGDSRERQTGSSVEDTLQPLGSDLKWWETVQRSQFQLSMIHEMNEAVGVSHGMKLQVRVMARVMFHSKAPARA